MNFAAGHCHALTATLLTIAPAGEAWGLFDASGEHCCHSAFRAPHTQNYLDAAGVETGPGALELKAARYRRGNEVLLWRPLTDQEVTQMISGGRARALRKAKVLARELLAASDQSACGKAPDQP